jgi:GntR family transcriptional repressor for pyruvate dehydrogenase complex
MLKTIKIKRITEEIVTQIRDHIANGELKAGDRLPSEREMAQQLGVSRPTVREALQVLEHTGFVEILQGSGTFIRDIGKQTLTDPLQALIDGSDQRYGDVYEFRTAIETWAVGMAAERRDHEEIKRLGQIIDQMKKCRAVGKPVDELDTEFHLAIARACRNTIYFHVAKTIFHLLTQVTRISHEELFLSEEDQIRLLADHEAIYKAVEAGDSKTARQLMQMHLKRVTQKIARTITKHPASQ